ncbi:MAG: serine hydrolase, partial [Gemmatimonadetes bacterium]|nr:serine hydrolase [Gemmatimonadota bacterium]
MNAYRTLTAAALLLAAVPAAAQAPRQNAASTPAPVTFPATPMGRLAQALLDAINSGDSARVRSWADTALSASARQREPLASQVASLQQIQAQSGGLELVSIKSPADPISWNVRVRRTGRMAGMLLGGGATTPARAEGVGVFVTPTPQEPWPQGKLADAGIRDAISAHVAGAAGRDDFSGVVLVMKGDSVFFRQSYGEADKSFHVANNPETRFNIASMGKMFTAVAIAQLV